MRQIRRAIAMILVFSMCIALASCMPNLKKYALQFADEEVSLSGFDKNAEDYKAFLRKISMFSSKLTFEVNRRNEGKGNFAISPISVYMTLAIACECADGETRQEILDAVGVTYEEVAGFTKYLYAYCNREFSQLNAYDRQEIVALEQLSNSIWLSQGMALKDSGIRNLAKNFNCDVFSVDFQSKDARTIINQYASYKTHEMIDNTVNFPKNTTFALMSVFYLKDIWNEIGKELTYTLEYHDFINYDGSKSSVNLLKSAYSKGIPFTTASYSTFYASTEHGFKIHFIVPAEGYALSEVFTEYVIYNTASRVDYGHVDDTNQRLHNTRVFFPAFSGSYGSDIKGILDEEFGIESLFDPDSCDFSGITSDSVYCNQLTHLCGVEVDASGIDGSSVTIASGGSTSPSPDQYQNAYHDFIVDRAFGYIITDDMGNILFTGVVNDS